MGTLSHYLSLNISLTASRLIRGDENRFEGEGRGGGLEKDKHAVGKESSLGFSVATCGSLI
jgi:hypothetical protein